MAPVSPACDQACAALRASPRAWLVTGAAGFIGSHLVARLLALGQRVVALDDFSTGHRRNVDDAVRAGGDGAAGRFRFIEGDIRDAAACREACAGVEVVLHQAALGSVPRSVADPLRSHDVNLTGFVQMLLAARDAGVGRFVYAASSSTYGDHPALPKVEDAIGRPLSPYAVTKYANELYADVFGRCYGMQTVGLRYFNVFGARQDPEGAYAAVIPRWVRALLAGETVRVNGDGQTSRDFCYVDNAVQANLLAATVTTPAAIGEVYNVAAGGRTSLDELYALLVAGLAARGALAQPPRREHGPFRDGDVRHSQADIGKASRLLGYVPTHDVRAGLEAALPWYVERLGCVPA
jgi:UDP-N-acetylglucosamine 4-epimerase